MNNKVIISCDIAKEKLDFMCLESREHFQLTNSPKGLQLFDLWQKQHGYSNDGILLAFESTGSYGKLLAKYAHERKIVYYEIPALEIKLSRGIARGKDDITDAKRIAEYVLEKGYKLRPSQLDSIVVEKLKQLRSTRDFLVKQRAAMKTQLKNLVEVLNLTSEDMSVASTNSCINTLAKEINILEKSIEEQISKDIDINTNYQLLLTITGIGKVIALDTILATNNFVKFHDWRKYASHCGCAPFPNESGKVVRKTKISKLARKDLKAHLTSGAKAAMAHDKDIKEYMERKLKEGKISKSITNAVRCKLIARMFAVVRKKTPFEKSYQQNLEIQ